MRVVDIFDRGILIEDEAKREWKLDWGPECLCFGEAHSGRIGMIVYHGTTRKRAARIRVVGFIPRKSRV